jgi:hypothetical protein
MSTAFTREKFERQPGEPTHTTWKFNQSWGEQPLQFRLNISGTEGSVKNIKLQIDNYKEILFPIELKVGESLVSDGTETIRLYDSNGKPKGTIKLNTTNPILGSGSHTILVDSEFIGDDAPKIEVQFKGMNKAEQIEVKKSL